MKSVRAYVASRQCNTIYPRQVIVDIFGDDPCPLGLVAIYEKSVSLNDLKGDTRRERSVCTRAGARSTKEKQRSRGRNGTGHLHRLHGRKVRLTRRPLSLVLPGALHL
jgi:hypothetical protein